MMKSLLRKEDAPVPRLDRLLDEITRLRQWMLADQLREYDRRYHGLDGEKE